MAVRYVDLRTFFLFLFKYTCILFIPTIVFHALRDIKVAANAMLWCGPFIILMGALTCFTGVSLYAVYRDCDPVRSQKISTYDKILTYFTAERLSPGVIGLIVSGVFSASLSTISAMMNSLAAVALEDYVKPLHQRLGVDFGDKKAVITAKALSLVNGVLCLFLALLASTMGGIVVIALSIAGAIGGPILGIFTLGMFSEIPNEAGTSIGIITALCICLWAVFGNPKPPPVMLPVSIEGCTNSTELIAKQMQFSNRFDIFGGYQVDPTKLISRFGNLRPSISSHGKSELGGRAMLKR